MGEDRGFFPSSRDLGLPYILEGMLIRMTLTAGVGAVEVEVVVMGAE